MRIDYYRSALMNFDTALRKELTPKKIPLEEFSRQVLDDLNMPEVVIKASDDEFVSTAAFSFIAKPDNKPRTIYYSKAALENNCRIIAIHEIAHLLHAEMLGALYARPQDHGVGFQTVFFHLLNSYVATSSQIRAIIEATPKHKRKPKYPEYNYITQDIISRERLEELTEGQENMVISKNSENACLSHRWIDEDGVGNLALSSAVKVVHFQFNVYRLLDRTDN